MNGYSSREIILLSILSFFIVIPIAIVKTKYSLGTFILFSIFFVILIEIGRLIYYKGNLPPKNPYRRRKPRPFTRDPLAIFL
jgi:hypothetical protein